MNAYVQFGIAMCLIVLLSLFGTAYLAVAFNRRAKKDLTLALTPLAELMSGQVDLDTAEAAGTYRGHLAFGRMANASDGPGREWQADLIDNAGGESWEWQSIPTKKPDLAPTIKVVPAELALGPELIAAVTPAIDGIIDRRQERCRVSFDADAGRLRLIRPLKTRRDIPARDVFEQELQLLVGLSPVNRRLQGAPDADIVGGRRPIEASEPGPAA